MKVTYKIMSLKNIIKKISIYKFTKYWILSAISLIAIRLLDVLYISINTPNQLSELKFILSGSFRDIVYLSKLSFLLFVSFAFISMFNKKLANVFTVSILNIYIIVTAILTYYYLNINTPLDSVILIYTFKEIIKITANSGGVNLWSIIFLSLPIAVFYLVKNKLKLKKSLYYFFFMFILFAFTPSNIVAPNSVDYDNNSQYYKAVCYPKHLFKTIKESLNKDFSYTTKEFNSLEDTYRKLHPDFKFIDKKYPYLHKTKYNDVLSPFFKDFDSRKPNFVFIIVESLGSSYSCYKAKTLSVTPFLDSLSKQSLYWPNCISVSERTFGVLPSVFSSFLAFTDKQTDMPNHFSFMQKLNKLAYKSNFFYGGDANFNAMKQYMVLNGVSLPIINSNISVGTDSENKLNNWGWDDLTLFRNRVEQVPFCKDSSFIDIFLTLSSHKPFLYKNKSYWEENLKKYLEKSENKYAAKYLNYIEPLAAIRYLDNSLKYLINKYKDTKQWENTIFIITGDHHISVVPTISSLDKYNVPLIIYSPKLKHGVTFNAVVSHLDITPSLLAFEETQTKTKIPKEAQWMGTGLDTSRKFKSDKIQAFVRNSREIVDFIDSNYYLNDKKLYAINKNLKLKLLKDSAKYTKMHNLCKNEEKLFHIVVDQDIISPPYATLNKSHRILLKYIKTGFENNDIPQYYKPENICKNNTISGQVSVCSAKDSSLDLTPFYRFRKDYRKLFLNFSFDYKFENNKDSSVFVLVKIASNDKTILLKKFTLNTYSNVTANNVYHFNINKVLRLNDYIYWTKMTISIENNNKTNIIFDNIDFKLEAKE